MRSFSNKHESLPQTAERLQHSTDLFDLIQEILETKAEFEMIKAELEFRKAVYQINRRSWSWLMLGFFTLGFFLGSMLQLLKLL